LSSREAEDEVLEDAARRHWSIENSLHWVLDVTFNENQSRVRDETAASNWAVLRKMALNLLKSDSEADTSIKGRRKQAGSVSSAAVKSLM
jgi:predicted transposase YbfD/YdcC